MKRLFFRQVPHAEDGLLVSEAAKLQIGQITTLYVIEANFSSDDRVLVRVYLKLVDSL